MKKNAILFIASILMTVVAYSQDAGVSINETNAPPDPSAMLDVSSQSKGVLIPRLSAAERAAISNPANSLLVFDTDDNTYYYYTGGSWIRIGTENNSWNTTGNGGTSPGSDYIGTQDAQDVVVKTDNRERARVTSSGNTGIGTATPTATVHVKNADGYNQVRMETSYTPANSGDPNGNIGDIAWDDDYVYIKTNNGWRRAKLTQWGGNGNGN